MFRNRNKVDKLIYKACESACHEYSAKDEVENGKKTDSVKYWWAKIWQKYLKLQWNIDDANEVKEITVVRTPMEKN